jgi:flagellar motility protein MotE (MotC chaperone)
VTGAPRIRAFFARSRESRRRERSTGTQDSRSSDARLESLTKRVEHLERLLEGLQDSVHRESSRQQSAIRDLQRKTEPSELARSLSKDARERGI